MGEPSSWWRKGLSALALLISLGYLYRHTDLEELKLAMETASLRYLLLASCLSVLTVLLSVIRWHIFLREVQGTPFKKTLAAFLSGYYLMTVLPPSVGHATKVKLVGGDYFKALSALAIGITTEGLLLSMAFIFVGFTKLGLMVLMLILASLIWEEGLYKTLDSLLAFWENSGLGGFISALRGYLKRGYSGWKRAKENKKAFALSFLLSLAVILLQVFGIMTVGRAFGLEVSLSRALYGFLMSVLFASLSGIPGGFGANEMGIVLGIGASTKATLTAFTYKFLFQYVYSIVGAVAFLSERWRCWKMKIALISDWYYPKVGGVATHMHQLAVYLKKRGHDVSIVTNDLKTGKEEELEELGIKLVKVPGVVSPILGINLTYSLKSNRELGEFLRDFEVVHTHHAFTPLSLKAVKAGRTLGRATLLTTHSISFSHESSLWKALGLTFPLFSHYLRYPHEVIAVSKAAKAFIEHFTDSPVRVIPNGVDDERFRPIGEREKERVKEELGVKGNLILYVSRMSFRKGPQVLLNAFQNIARERDDVTLVMVGSGEMLPFLKAQAKFLGVEDRVKFMGYVSDDLLPKLYASADVFVLPSITAEAFGIVVLEAMASGVPVVTTTVGGIPEVVKESGSGLLVPPGDEASLAEAVLGILSNKELAKKFGEAGRKAVERRYSWRVVASEIEGVYEEVLREGL